MLVGDALSYFREGLDIKQKDFICNEVTQSYYSRIENNENDITVLRLLNILKKNNITVNEFFYLVNEDEDDFIKIYRQVKVAYYNEKPLELKHIINKLPEEDYMFKISTLLLKKILKECISDKEKEEIINYLTDINRWSEYHILIFLLGTKIFNVHELLFLFGFFSKNVYKAKSYKIYEKDILLSLLNIIEVCLIEKRIDEAQYFLNIVPQTMTEPFYLFEKVLMNFYESLILFTKGVDKISNYKECINTLDIFEKNNIDHIPNILKNLLSLYNIKLS